MRALQKIAVTIVLVGFSVVSATGCAPSGPNGTALPPAASAPMMVEEVAAAKTAPWLQFGYNAGHSGYNPLEKTLDAKNVSKLQIGWNHKTLVQPNGIVVDRNVAYVDDMGHANAGLFALDAATGKQKWYADVHLNGPWGSFTHAVSAVAGDVVISPCSNNSSTKFLTGLCGLDTSTGKLLWKRYCKEYQGSPCGGLVNEGTSPTLYAGRIYFQSVQGVNEQPDTQALDPKTGAILWDVAGIYHCPDAGDSSDNPLPVAGGIVFAVLGCQGQQGATEICGLSAANGHAVWCDQSPTAYIQVLIAGNGTLYVTEPGSSNVVVVALDAKTGAKRWAANLPSSNYTAMATANNRLFVEDGGAGVFALSIANGKTLWGQTSNGNLYGAGVLSVADGLVYADGGGGNNGNVAIAALNESNGKVIWTSGSIGNGGAPATPVIVDGKIYTGCYTMCELTLPSARAARAVQ